MVNRRERSDEYLQRLREHIRESITFLSNRQKPERERCIVRAFLRCLGVPFKENDLQIGQAEPVDVAAREARFQVTEVLAEGRRRHQEYKQRLQKLNEFTTDEDLWEPWEPPSPVSWQEFAGHVVERLSHKMAHADIDALVYVNLGQTFLDVGSEVPDFSDTAALGWRSVAAVYLPYAVVMYAADDAPEFLRNAVGLARSAWTKPYGWFEPSA